MKRRGNLVLVVDGACGRLAQRIVQLALEDKDLTVAAALEAPGHPDLGRDVGEVFGGEPAGLTLTDALPPGANANVVIACAGAAGGAGVLETCVQRRTPIVVVGTGLTRAQREEVEAAAHQTAVLVAPNPSLGAGVLTRLVRDAAALLKEQGYDVEIVERHHRHKKDSPSGTALHLAQTVQQVMGQTEIRHGRSGEEVERPPHEIGVHAVRVGGHADEHTVIFSATGETLELIHRAHGRDCYAWGALQAAKFLADRPPGRYSMDDVLGPGSVEAPL